VLAFLPDKIQIGMGLGRVEQCVSMLKVSGSSPSGDGESTCQFAVDCDM
jgi:hypothetical protein